MGLPIKQIMNYIKQYKIMKKNHTQLSAIPSHILYHQFCITIGLKSIISMQIIRYYIQ